MSSSVYAEAKERDGESIYPHPLLHDEVTRERTKDSASIGGGGGRGQLMLRVFAVCADEQRPQFGHHRLAQKKAASATCLCQAIVPASNNHSHEETSLFFPGEESNGCSKRATNRRWHEWPKFGRSRDQPRLLLPISNRGPRRAGESLKPVT